MQYSILQSIITSNCNSKSPVTIKMSNIKKNLHNTTSDAVAKCRACSFSPAENELDERPRPGTHENEDDL